MQWVNRNCCRTIPLEWLSDRNTSSICVGLSVVGPSPVVTVDPVPFHGGPSAESGPPGPLDATHQTRALCRSLCRSLCVGPCTHLPQQ